jgi:heme/copper-type cytochrome/quinol oxidase subunit 4
MQLISGENNRQAGRDLIVNHYHGTIKTDTLSFLLSATLTILILLTLTAGTINTKINRYIYLLEQQRPVVQTEKPTAPVP